MRRAAVIAAGCEERRAPRDSRTRFVGAGARAVRAAPLAGLTAGAIYQVDWYAYKPTGWVLQDAAANSPALAGQAFGELKRRWVSGGLNPQQISTLTETALAEQALSQLRRAPVRPRLIFWTGYTAQGLTEKQVQRFFNQMVLINLVVRSPVVAGQAAPAALKVDYRGPTNVYEPRIKVRRVEIDGKCRSRDGQPGQIRRGQHGAHQIRRPTCTFVRWASTPSTL